MTRAEAALVLLGAILLPGRAAGQERVVEVAIEGNPARGADAIRRFLGTRPDRPLDRKTVEADLRSLWKEMRIRAEAFEEPLPGGVRVVFRVFESPVLREFEFRGNRSFGREKLMEAAGLVAGAGLDEVSAAAARAAIERHHRDEGYLFAEVGLRIDRAAGRAVFEVSEGPPVRVREVRLEGNGSFPASTFLGVGKNLKGEMQLRGGWFLFRGSEFKERVLREDLIALRRFYRNEGYRDAVVEVRDLDVSEDRRQVSLTILIDEGPRYVVSSVAIEGNEAFPEEELRPLLTLKPEMSFTDGMLARDGAALARYYGERGYARHFSIRDGWRFERERAVYGEGSARVAVTYRIHEGPKTRLREIRIEGNAQTADRVIRRELSVFPGEVVNTTEIARSIAQLDGLQFFTDASGLPATRYRFASTDDPGWKDLRIDLEEGSTGRMEFTGGVSTVEGAFAVVSFVKRNFDLFGIPTSFGSALEEIVESRAFTGAGQELQLYLAPGTRFSQYGVRFHEPDVFGDHLSRTSLTTDLSLRMRAYPDYTETRRGERIAFGKEFVSRPGEGSGVELGLRNEKIEVASVDPGGAFFLFEQEGRNALRSVRLDGALFRLDVPIQPTEGHRLRGSYELAGGPWGGDFDFHKAVVTGQGYLLLSRDERGRATVLALSGRLGWASAFGGTAHVPYTERFFAGGPGSVRGFDFRGIGPKQNGSPAGGEALATGSAELRFPLYSATVAGRIEEIELIGGRVFLDAGSLGLDLSDSTFGEVRVGAGLGLSIRIPVLPQFPIALDFGIPLRRERTDDLQVFTFSIGVF